MFHAEGVQSALLKLETAYGPCGSELFGPVLRTLHGLDPTGDLQPENARLRDTIDTLRAAAFALNDRFTLRFFNHAQTVVHTTFGL